jgi:hypothetical protein
VTALRLCYIDVQVRRQLGAAAAHAEDAVQKCILAGTHLESGAERTGVAQDAQDLVALLQKRNLKACIHCLLEVAHALAQAHFRYVHLPDAWFCHASTSTAICSCPLS